MYHQLKQYVKTNFPTFFVRARDLKDQAVIEVNTLRQVGIKRLFKQFLSSKEKWKTELPLQSIGRAHVDIASLKDVCTTAPNFKEGGHTYYFPPEVIRASSLKELFSWAPENAGLKIVKRQGGINTPFAALDKTCNAHSMLAPSHKDLMLIHGIFWNLGLGPRLYDLLELQFKNGDVHVAYIVEHIEGKTPSMDACTTFVQNLQKLEAENTIKLVNWNGYKDMDFICPSCNGNLMVDTQSNTLKYVDLQNFAIGDYYHYLKKVALEAAAASHFGQKSYLMGGEYLYQEVPGLNLGAKRSPAARFEVFKKLLSATGVTLKDKFVMDVGCNMGLMGAQYLKEGAAWLHGFDMPEVVPETEKVLSSIGCTRFSTTGLLLGENVSLTHHLPHNLKDKLNGCVISYLAIRGHIGWVKELGQIPWEFMLYEGHQEEDRAANYRFIDALKKLKPCSIAAEGWISDANSTPRYIAIIKAG